jgi:hypothetical protein
MASIESQRSSGTGVRQGREHRCPGRVGRVGGWIACRSRASIAVAYLFNNYGYTSVFVYIAVCWALVAILITVFGPKTKGRALV